VDLDQAFKDMQAEVDAEPELVAVARSRRNKFADAFKKDADVNETIFIGSISRGTQIEPIKDVDLVVVYSEDDHPAWGADGSSAEDALAETQARVTAFFGSDGSEEADFVRLARADNHAVKCFLDDPDDPDAFTVDVVPALRTESGLLITERESQTWIRTDPEYLNQRSQERHDAWRDYRRLVRVLKRWNRDHGSTMIPLLVEVMALEHLPLGDRRRALQAFFAAAVPVVSPTIKDPAGISAIQPGLDAAAARTKLEKAADASWRAVAAEDRDNTDLAACYWREVFGEIFPAPPGGCDGLLNAGAAAAAGAAIPRTRRPARDNPGLTLGIRWYEAEPRVLVRELAAMTDLAPEMAWIAEGAGKWKGRAPQWPFPRPRPEPGLTRLLGDEQLRLKVSYHEAFPAVAPILLPLAPVPPRERRLRHDWHVNGDGTLCMLAADVLWRPDDTAADLVIKASGWFIEYRLKERGLVAAMSETGLYDDTTRDELIGAVDQTG